MFDMSNERILAFSSTPRILAETPEHERLNFTAMLSGMAGKNNVKPYNISRCKTLRISTVDNCCLILRERLG